MGSNGCLSNLYEINEYTNKQTNEYINDTLFLEKPCEHIEIQTNQYDELYLRSNKRIKLENETIYDNFLSK
jgi:hypothetical protein